MEIKINLIKVCTYLLLLISLLSCHSGRKTKTDNNITKSMIPIQNQWTIGLRDTILIEYIGNSFVSFHFQGDSIYNVEWGNDSIRNISEQKFDVLGNGVLGVSGTSDNYILLSQGCGTSCVYYVFLPLKANAVEKIYYFALAYNLENNLVAYAPAYNNETFIRVENYLTGQIMDIKEKNICQALKIDCIDNIYFDKLSLVLKWQGEKCNNNQPDLHEKIIPVIFK